MLTSGFFNSVDGDRKYNADQMSDMFEGLIGGGVFETVGGKFKVSANTGMTVSVATGRAVVDTKWVKSDAITNITLSAAHISLPRYTIIVLRYVKEERRVILTAIDGTPASTPSVPSVVRDAQYYDICLAKIYVNAAVSSITDANITDTRNDSDVCGYVTGLIEQVDTSDLYDQWEAAYDEAAAQLEQTNENFSQEALSLMQNEQIAFMNWFDTLTSRLRVDTYIQKFEQTFDPASTGSTALPWSQLPGYTYNEQDVIIASINGLEAVRSYDYAVDGYSIDFFNLNTSVSSSVHVVVLKSRIGYNADDARNDVPLVVKGFEASADSVDETVNIEGSSSQSKYYLSVIGGFKTGYVIDETVSTAHSSVVDSETQTDSATSSTVKVSVIRSSGADTITYETVSGESGAKDIAVGAVYELPRNFFIDMFGPHFVLVDSKFYDSDNGRPKQIIIEPGSKTYIVVAFSARKSAKSRLNAEFLDDKMVMRVNGTALESLIAKLPALGGLGANAYDTSVSSPHREIMAGTFKANSYEAACIEIQFAKYADVTGYLLYEWAQTTF